MLTYEILNIGLVSFGIKIIAQIFGMINEFFNLKIIELPYFA